MVLVYMLTLGVNWWDQCYHIYHTWILWDFDGDVIFIFSGTRWLWLPWQPWQPWQGPGLCTARGGETSRAGAPNSLASPWFDGQKWGILTNHFHSISILTIFTVYINHVKSIWFSCASWSSFALNPWAKGRTTRGLDFGKGHILYAWYVPWSKVGLD